VEFGPAHTKGDLVVHLPDDGVVFTGDLLFIGGTPILWDGPVENWLRACEQLERWNPQVIVPGHGPLTDLDGVRAVARYLTAVEQGCAERFDAGMTAREATVDLDRSFDHGEFSEWGDRERIAICVETCWRHLDETHPTIPIMELFAVMAMLATRYRS
jgi:glyoxylase-like metal-dependent hydrolase (beta-lactamase superfamily II)